MKILVLAHPLRAGGGRATCMNVLHHLTQLDRENQYYLILPDQEQYRSLRLEGRVHRVEYYSHKFGYIKRIYFDKIALKGILRDYKPDLLWAMGGLGLQHCPCPQAISIQNPYVMYPPRHYGPLGPRDRLWVYFLRRAFHRQLPSVQLFIFQTHTMEKRLKEQYDFAGRTLVTWKAVSSFAADSGRPLPENMKRYAGKYKLIYVTRYYPHKGLEKIVETFDRFRDALKDVAVFITIEPDQHSAAARLLADIREKGLQDSVVNLGRLPQQELSAYYKASDALLMPTLMESFSGSHLEAMHFGLPILTSDLDFAREVCQDAAEYFDPWSPEDIRDHILALKADPARAKALVEKGKRRLEEFTATWEGIAEEIRRNLESIV
ncbi:MAG: glycosyltransferase [Candidatus Sumerlaeota bacterium]